MLIFIGIIVFFVVAVAFGLRDQKREDEAKRIRDEKLKEFIKAENIQVTQEYRCCNILKTVDAHFIVDNLNKQIVLSNKSAPVKIPFREIIGCEILLDKEVAGGVGRAVVGGVLAGGAGAIVGAQTAKKHIMSYSVVLYRDNLSNPKYEIVLISQKTQTTDITYSNAVSFAQNVNASVKAILSQNQKTTEIKTENIVPVQKKESPEIEKIKEYKELLDQGIITEDEFNIKKKELLNL